ncbi:peptide-methionine (S)-S-oxide reductase, partial [Oleiphilus sp. HI0061]
DQGTQYRSGIYTFNDEQSKLANESLQQYQVALTARGFSEITTEIKQASEFYYAEEYHQQYLDKNPDGYCGLGGCGVELF